MIYKKKQIYEIYNSYNNDLKQCVNCILKSIFNSMMLKKKFSFITAIILFDIFKYLPFKMIHFIQNSYLVK